MNSSVKKKNNNKERKEKKNIKRRLGQFRTKDNTMLIDKIF